MKPIATIPRLHRASALFCLGICLPACAGAPPRQPSQPPAAANSAAQPAIAAPGSAILHSDTPLMPRPLTSFGAATHNGWLYVLGGYFGEPHAYSREGQSGALYRMRLDGSRASWEELPGIEPLQSTVLVAHEHALVRVGGMRATNAGDEPSHTVSVAEAARYLPDTATWQPLPPLPEPRSSHDAAVVGNTLYVIGGWRLAGDAAPAWHGRGLALDLTAAAPAWTEFPVPFERRALAVAALAGQLVAIGGMTSENQPTSRVDIYDVRARAWRRGPDFPGSGFGVAATGLADAVYASGRDGMVYRLPAGGKAWEPVKTLGFARFFHRLVPASDKALLAVGGILAMDSDSRVQAIETVTLAPGPEERPQITRWTLRAPGSAKNRQGIFLREHVLYVFGGNNSLGQHDFAPENFVDEAFRLHLGSLEWAPMARYPAKRQSMETELVDDGLGLVVGGFGHDGEVARTHGESFVYDFDRDAWTPRPGTLPVPRSQFGLARQGSELWVFGGLDYDPRRSGENFHHLAPVLKAAAADPAAAFKDSGVALPRARRAFGNAMLGSRYYLIGGMQDNFQLVDACDVYDFQKRAWSTIPAPRRTRLSPELVALGGKLYLAGGSARIGEGDMQPDRSIEVFDPESQTWSVLIEELPIETRHMRMFAYGDHLLIYTAHNTDGQIHLLLIDVGATAEKPKASPPTASR